jgi:putative membrane protein
MPSAWLDARAKDAFARAVADVEAVSSVELAIAVRRSARARPHLALAMGCVAAWLTLAFMLFSDPSFALAAFLIDPLLAGIAAGWIASRLPVARWLTREDTRRRDATAAARAAFVERGIHLTRGRTGVLVYCALAEGAAVLIADAGVERAIARETLEAAEQTIDRALAQSGVATAEAITRLAPIFAAALPRLADDSNELHDALDHDTALETAS